LPTSERSEIAVTIEQSGQGFRILSNSQTLEVEDLTFPLRNLLSIEFIEAGKLKTFIVAASNEFIAPRRNQ